jgi:hypothetical protein
VGEGVHERIEEWATRDDDASPRLIKDLRGVVSTRMTNGEPTSVTSASSVHSLGDMGGMPLTMQRKLLTDRSVTSLCAQ